MTNNVVLYNLIESDVFKVSGEFIGSIDELLIDPYTGIVKSLRLMTDTNKTVTLPWSAMRFDKSRQTFFLTHIGELVLAQKCH
ncbi:MAG: PRC-barrel domain-containing protein [Porticoccus sp.]|nr:PRC-barrel domain-containing protein [Porticoccus sp.]